MPIEVSEDLQKEYRAISDLSNQMALRGKALASRVKGPAEGPLSVSLFMFNQKLSEAMHRVSDMMVQIAQTDPQFIERVIDDKIARGELENLTGGPIDITGGKVN